MAGASSRAPTRPRRGDRASRCSCGSWTTTRCFGVTGAICSTGSTTLGAAYADVFAGVRIARRVSGRVRAARSPSALAPVRFALLRSGGRDRPRARTARRTSPAAEWELDDRRRPRRRHEPPAARASRSFARRSRCRGTIVDGGVVPDRRACKRSNAEAPRSAPTITCSSRSRSGRNGSRTSSATAAPARARDELDRDGDRGHARSQAHAGDGSATTARRASRDESRAGGVRPRRPPARHGARRRRRRGDLPDVRLVHRHDPGARPPDGVRAGLQRLARRVVPAPARRVHPGRGRAGARRRVGVGASWSASRRSASRPR